ncbi:MAG: GTP pyrophosphokinase family protein [Clostridiales bacterium]|nr:GTP pyrophosphokinase family protein [Clostridiales bacterium]
MEIINWKEMLYTYEQAVAELTVKFTSMMEDYRRLGMYSPIDSVSGRVKKSSSILEKASRKHIPMDRIEQEVEDIAGVRILCRFVEDIYKVIDLIRMRDGKDMTIVEEKDYITNTKPSGYRSFHIVIKYPMFTAKGYCEVLAEIQIRTLAMNFWATAEHSLKYKYSGNIPEDLQKRLINCAEAAFHLDQEMATIRTEIMYAQRLNEIKNNLVASIIDDIQNLYHVAKFEDVDDLNKKFIDLFEEGDIEKLKQFNEQLNIMTELYRA